MKVLFVPLRSTPAPHFETELELMQDRLDAGDEVEVLLVRHLAVLLSSWSDGPLTKARYEQREARGLRLLTPQPRINLVTLDGPEESVPEFGAATELPGATVDGLDIGYAVMSSLVSRYRTPIPDVTRHRRDLEVFWDGFLKLYRLMTKVLEEGGYDRVYVFNGRFVMPRAVLRACQRAGVDVYLHERGCDIHHYMLFKNHLPHDLPAVRALIEKQWEAGTRTPEQKLELATAWFEERRAGVKQAWRSFVTGQEAGRVPEGWAPERRNVVIFNSSEDEFVAIGGEWSDTLYKMQNEGIRRIAADLREVAPEAQLYLRVHPNLAGVDNVQTRGIRELESAGVRVIPPEDPVSSYALMDEADAVITFGSTVGIEAAFAGKPSILAGQTFYRELGSTYNPASHQELLDLLTTPELPAKDRTGAIKYGYYMKTFGYPFRHFAASDIFTGAFKGQPVDACWPVRTLSKLRNSMRGVPRRRRQQDS